MKILAIAQKVAGRRCQGGAIASNSERLLKQSRQGSFALLSYTGSKLTVNQISPGLESPPPWE
jgi:hypothetical protein